MEETTQTPTIQKRWLNPDELEAEFNIKKSTQAKKRRNRNIPFSKQGNFIYYDREKINKWLESHAVVE
jgi:hypothetical protein